jgi:hypothetical protein
MLNLRLRPFPSIRSLVVRATAVAAVLGAAVVSSACSGSPSAPGTLSAERRVETGSGGGTFCPGIVCEGITGRIEIVSNRGSLNGSTGGSQVGSEPARFQLTSNLKGAGQIEDGFISFTVERDTATISTIWFRSHGQIFENTNVTAPASVREISDSSCRSGRLIVTTITTTLENLGKTTITEQHCAI